MSRVKLPATMLACFSATVCLYAVRHHPANPGGPFDYYILSLSWAPNYCAGHPNDHSIECRVGKHANFVLHGLWPQLNDGQQPTNCVPASPVSSAMVHHMLLYFPSRGLIQHEWATHGTCSGLSAQEYFGQVEQAYTAVRVPEAYRSLDHDQTLGVKDIERSFAEVNGASAGAFRVSCHARELVGVEVCLTKDLEYQACTSSRRECPASEVLMRSVQ